MQRFVLLIFFLSAFLISSAQENDTISLNEVSRIMHTLASDSMKGRKNYSVELTVAAHFIAREFEKDSLKYFPGFESYFHQFTTRTEGENEKLSKISGADRLFNVIGVLEGKSRANEVVIFSAHYDHVGIDRLRSDSIFNGANDNASGTTALLSLAHYFSKRNDNERTLIFCAFAGEELGMTGSNLFSQQIVSDAIVAMINIEMIGMTNVAGRNAFFVTGADYSDLAGMLKRNLKGTKFKIRSEPPAESMLFIRSDNFPFVKKGVPAHSIMCSDDKEPCYHQPCDEIKKIDLKNMTAVIRAIAIATKGLVMGTDTPKRIKY